MAGEEGGAREAGGDGIVRLKEAALGEWRRIKEHAETYPYVWGSYILVYGGLGTLLALRWRKLRRTEDSVRVLQARLRQLVEQEEKQAGSSAPLPSEKSSGSS